MQQKSINLFHLPFKGIFKIIKNEYPGYSYNFSKHAIEIEDNKHEMIGFIRLPLHININDDLSIIDEASTVLYISIESGYAAICMMQGKINTYHTTFTAYMSRKKQGFSQVKYLNKKGKSRAGSRVRLAATTEFFESINRITTELMEDFQVDRIALNCNATLLPYLFQSKEPCPFEKKDPRLYKIPLHIQQSNFSNLMAAIKKLMAPMLFYNSSNESVVNHFE